LQSLLVRKCVSVGNCTWDHWVCSQDHRGGHWVFYTASISVLGSTEPPIRLLPGANTPRDAVHHAPLPTVKARLGMPGSMPQRPHVSSSRVAQFNTGTTLSYQRTFMTKEPFLLSHGYLAEILLLVGIYVPSCTELPY
jgi:hypothetical protein